MLFDVVCCQDRVVMIVVVVRIVVSLCQYMLSCYWVFVCVFVVVCSQVVVVRIVRSLMSLMSSGSYDIVEILRVLILSASLQPLEGLSIGSSLGIASPPSAVLLPVGISPPQYDCSQCCTIGGQCSC